MTFFKTLSAAFVLNFLLLSHFSYAQKTRPVLERFAYEEDLNSGKTSMQMLPFGMFSNASYLEENPQVAQGLFGREMELVSLPVWEDKWTSNTMWVYLCRIFPQEPNRPLTQFFNKITFQGDSAYYEIFYLPPHISFSLKGAWHENNPFGEIKMEDLVSDSCKMIGWSDNVGNFYSESTNTCKLPVNATFDRYTMSNRLNKKAWFMAVSYFDMNGKLINKDEAPMRYDRLDKKTCRKKIKQYQELLHK